jgi:hypothetical protein
MPTTTATVDDDMRRESQRERRRRATATGRQSTIATGYGDRPAMNPARANLQGKSLLGQ